MARITKQDITPRKKALENALFRFEEALLLFKQEPEESRYYRATRDSLVQTFEFSIELFWKYLSLYLEFSNGIPTYTPRESIRQCVETKLITPQEARKLGMMVDDRNETSHTYDESVAKKLAKKIPEHHKLLKILFNRLTLD